MPPFLLLSAEDAEILRVATADREMPLDPREIAAGPHVGKWATSPNAVGHPLFEDLAEVIARGTVTAVDIARAWPPEEE